MGGILDLFDSPQLLGQLLGGSMGEGSMMPGNVQPPPQPPMNGGIGSDAGQAPGAPQPAGNMPMPPQRPQIAMPMPPRPPQPMASSQGFDENGFAAKPDYVTPPGPGPQPDFAAAASGVPSQPPIPPGAPPPQTAMLPMPPPRPQLEQAPGATPTVGQAPGPPLNILPPPRPAPGVNLGAPSGSVPAPRPPASEFAAPPQGANTGGGLAGALGINRPTMQAAMAGVGKGLTAVGAQPLGASKGQAFAAGAGGALTGVSDQQNKHFDQISTTFKDLMLAKNSGDNAEYKKAQANYLTARAASLNAMTAKGGTGSNAWQNTPLGQVAVIEQRVAAYDGPRRKSIDAAVRSGALAPEEAKKQYETLDKQVEGFRSNMYKSSGLDPSKAEKMRTAGEKADNPIDTKGMTLDQFHAQVPMGAWFTDQNGKPRQRTVPPPGSEAPAQQGGGQTRADAAGDAEADRSAMTEAA